MSFRLVFGAFVVTVVSAGLLFSSTSHALESGVTVLEDVNRPLQDDLPEIRKRKQLRVLIPYSRTFYFLDGGRVSGLAAEFLLEFEKHINTGTAKRQDHVTIIIVPTRRDKLITKLAEGRAELAFGNLTITKKRLELVDFSTALYPDVDEVLVTVGEMPELTALSEIAGMTIHTRASSSYYESLASLNEQLASDGLEPIKVVEVDERLEDEELLEMVNAGIFNAIIVDSHKAKFWARIFANVKIHPKIAVRERGEIAWAVRKTAPKLKAELNSFVKETKLGTRLGNILLKRYYSDTKWLGLATSEKNLKRLADLENLFIKYGKIYRIDPKFLAALAFQESKYEQKLKSSAGAVGIMQIKPTTAAGKGIEIKDINKLENNIHAGVKYLRFLVDRYFSDGDVDEFNRILFALASYNAGPARIAGLQKKARDPNVWFNSVEHVAGAEIGTETVKYVSNIYAYYIAFRMLQDALAEIEAARSKSREN
jgi:membrane-bound lytic murein transglycosylase MltF